MNMPKRPKVYSMIYKIVEQYCSYNDVLSVAFDIIIALPITSLASNFFVT
ncbi:hypothetical protein RchiOBHm_Chr2g0157271 [Rosa chinensis]|uniref:Uncharacterized protein n=1 Tax=Rosa chinensis TaxID=74649 RepID=A0A2P6S1Q6_ROSCH|nr:hypothetical protein RchiOBHm_Chr2g0157271 [Rosa chinensis]